MHLRNSISPDSPESPETVCALISRKVYSLQLSDSSQCQQYAQTPILGAPSAFSYGNCSVASYCATFDTPFTGSLRGYNLTAITAQGFSDATIEFLNAEDCANAHTKGAFSCPSEYNVPIVRNDSSLIIQECGSGGNPAGSFSIPTGEVETFNFLPYYY